MEIPLITLAVIAVLVGLVAGPLRERPTERHASSFVSRSLSPLALIATGLVLAGMAVQLRPQPTGESYLTVPEPDEDARAHDAQRYAGIVADAFRGAKIGAHSNQLSTDDPITFDHAKFDTAGMWDPLRPTRLTMPTAGFYRVVASVTVLGSGYKGSPASQSWIMTVTRNGDPSDFVCAETRTNESPDRAQLADCSTTDWFLAGDYLELNVTPGRTVESNWPGRGNLSPLLTVVRAS